ncbi:MAG: GDSL-type esterase/lipase family protein [Bacteroidales bacterium]|nr:GDSL-type esterase/lipase family protein [Bacteroidales bacterium]
MKYGIFSAPVLLAVAVLLSGSAPGKIRVACIGDSVTYGHGIEGRDSLSYPAQLQKMLGDRYEVRNFGHSGATLMRRGHNPYDRLPEFRAAMDFKADMVVIHLGLNDTDPRDWPDYAEDFIPDYLALVDSFRTANPRAEIWVCRMTPIFHGHRRYLSGTRDWHAEEQKAIERIAKASGSGLIDLYGPLAVRPDLFRDNLHPDAEGAGIMAGIVYGALTGNYGGLKVPVTYSDNMVLQRGRPIRIAGTADRGEKVKVAFAGESLCTKADERGRWAVEFPPMDAGGPYSLRISARSGKLEYSNVWVGEVWLCAGQSNMEFQLSRCSTAGEDIAAAASNTSLHLFNMHENWLTNDYPWPESALDSVNRLQYFTPEGWKISSPESARDFSAIGYHFGRLLADSLGCHVGIISCAVGGSTTESWVDREVLRWEYPQVLYDWNHGDFGQPWARERTLSNIRLSGNALQRHPYHPGYLFDAGIAPLSQTALRGVLWYQGESNAHNVEMHEALFPLMVKSFRNCWGDSLFVQVIQLSGIGTRPSWPRFRDSQRRLADAVAGVGLTVCSDLGHPTDVHPRAKRPVAERSVAGVLNRVYGRSDIVPCGPEYLGFEVDGSRLRLRFGYAEGLTGSRGFEVAGPDGVYHPAVARVEGTQVVVFSDLVGSPCAVRYGWTPGFDGADLRNGALLPASSFRDERFPF